MARTLWKPFVFALVVALAMTGAVNAQEEEKERNWSNKTDLGLSMTTGNSENTNVSFANNYKRNWTKAEMWFDAAALRNKTTTRTVTNADGTGLVESETSAVTAETYALGLGYRRDITGRLYWFADGSWYRNTPAGIDDRFRVGAGIGYTIIESERHTFRGELGVAYTDESQTSGFTQDFTGGRAMLDYNFKLTDSATLESNLVYFGDFDESDNWQANWLTALTVSMSKSVALKLGYAVLYDNQPAILVIPAEDGIGADLPFEADTTDTIFTAAVVLNF